MRLAVRKIQVRRPPRVRIPALRMRVAVVEMTRPVMAIRHLPLQVLRNPARKAVVALLL
jgi:hypothetical protein